MTDMELEVVIKGMKSGKATGPDGFTLMYYRHFQLTVTTSFLFSYYSLCQPALHPVTLEAHILVIPKEGKDPLIFSSYRHLSLMNTNLKVFAKILAHRLSPHVA